MKNMFWWVSAACAATAALLILGKGRTQPVETLAHELEVAWSDHHTVA